MSVVDYFFVCGLDCINKYQIVESDNVFLNTNPSPVDCRFKAQINYFYPTCIPEYNFDKNSTALITLPNGISLFTECELSSIDCPVLKRHSFVITREDGSRIRGISIIFPEKLSGQLKKSFISMQEKFNSSIPDLVPLQKSDPDNMFYWKAIGFLTRTCWIEGLYGLLEDVWMSMHLDLPKYRIDSCIFNAVNDFTVFPTQNNYLLQLQGPYRLHSFFVPYLFSLSELHPLFGYMSSFEYPLQTVFDIFSVSDFIKLLACILLEYRVLILSKNIEYLVLVAESITKILQPFQWSHVYAPVLPRSLMHFIDAPVPFLMGILLGPDSINLNNTQSFRDPHQAGFNHSSDWCNSDRVIELASEAKVCYAYVDLHQVITYDDVPQFPDQDILHNAIIAILDQSSSTFCLDDVSIDSFDEDKFSQHFKENSIPKTDEFEETVAPIVRRPKFAPSILSTPATPEKVVIQHRASVGDTPIGVSTFSAPLTSINQSSRTISSSGSNSIENSTGYSVVKAQNSDLFHSSSSSLSEDSVETEFAYRARRYARNNIQNRFKIIQYKKMLLFNLRLRDLFMRHFASLFRDYENFILSHNTPLDTSTESPLTGLDAFDKVGFLSDQPNSHLGFLSAFLESQIFSIFLEAFHDLCIEKDICDKLQDIKPEYNDLALFRVYIKQSSVLLTSKPSGGKSDKDEVYSLDNLNSHQTVSNWLDGIFDNNIVMTSKPDIMTEQDSIDKASSFYLPDLKESRLFTGSNSGPRYFRTSIGTSNLRKFETSEIDSAESKLLKRPKISSYQIGSDKSKSSIAQAHKDFVSTLLEECRQKTKRMVVSKMGREAIGLGHSEAMVVKDMEENILVSGLCDLIERTWSHGLIKKQGKSALWTHLMQFACASSPSKTNSPRYSGSTTPSPGKPYQSRAQTANTIRSSTSSKSSSDTYVSRPGIDSRRLTSRNSSSSMARTRENSVEPDLKTPSRKNSTDLLRDAFFQSLSGSILSSPVKNELDPSATYFDFAEVFGLPRGSELVDDLGTVRMISGIKTDVGLSRAFIRFALEKKVLSDYLKKLLSNQNLLKDLYEPYAFLRKEDEREQLLYYMLSLNTVDYYPFSRMLTDATLTYCVYIQCSTGSRWTPMTAVTRRGRSSSLFSTDKSEHASRTPSMTRTLKNAVPTTQQNDLKSPRGAWLSIQGHHCSSGRLQIVLSDYREGFVNPRDPILTAIANQASFFSFQIQNLGMLSNILIGLDQPSTQSNSSTLNYNNDPSKSLQNNSRRWFIDYVLIYVKPIGHLYYYPCNRWLGRGASDSDGSIRLLIGERVPVSKNNPYLAFVDNIPLAQNSFHDVKPANLCLRATICRPIEKSPMNMAQVHEKLAGAVNNLLKHFYKCAHDVSVTQLLCAPGVGLIPALENVFRHGFKSSKFFQKKTHIFDYFERCATIILSEPSIYRKINLSPDDRKPSLISLMSPQVQKPSLGQLLQSNITLSPNNSNLLTNDFRRMHLAPFSNASQPNSPALRRNSFLSNDKNDFLASDPLRNRKLRGSSLEPSGIDDSCETIGSTLKIPNKTGTLSNNRAVIQASCVLANSLGDAALSFIKAIQLINMPNCFVQLSKEDKFQRLMCIGLRDHQLVSWISMLSMNSVTSQMYEERSIMMHPGLRLEVQTILASIDEYEIQLEPVLLGIFPI